MSDPGLLTDDDLRAMLAYCEQATAGPWTAEGEEIITKADGLFIRWLSHDSPWRGGYEGSGPAKADAAFMARSRTDFPRVLRALLALREEHARVVRDRGETHAP